MEAPKKPDNEADRLAALRSYELLDTEDEVGFQDIAKLASYICQTPIAAVTLVDQDRQWFKATVGLDPVIRETERDISFCGHIVYAGKGMMVKDAALDPRFADNPLVTGELGIRFYAGQPLIDEDGHLLGSLCVIDQTARELAPAQMEALQSLANQVVAQMKLRRDAITQRALSEALEDSQRLLKQYFSRDDVYMGLVELDRDTIYQLYNNPVVEKFLEEKGIDARRFERHGGMPGIERWFKAYEDCAATGQSQTFDTEDVLAGTVLRATVHFVGVSKSRRPQLAFMVEDVTKQRADERLLERQRHMVINSSKLSALGEMAAGMAHEINNPLAIIGGRAQEMRMLLKRGHVTEEHLVKPLESIEKTVTRISKIIRGLRSFARESSRDPFEPTKMGDVLQETLAFCTARFSAHGVQLEVRNADPDLLVNCRPAEMSQVFLNLLNNAFDAVQNLAAPRWVRVELSKVGERLRVTVTDSGPGIPAEIRDKIMQPFFTTKAVNHGTGLGLSITRGIVESHGGQLELDPSFSHTRFVIILPLGASAVGVA